MEKYWWKLFEADFAGWKTRNNNMINAKPSVFECSPTEFPLFSIKFRLLPYEKRFVDLICEVYLVEAPRTRFSRRNNPSKTWFFFANQNRFLLIRATFSKFFSITDTFSKSAWKILAFDTHIDVITIDRKKIIFYY